MCGGGGRGVGYRAKRPIKLGRNDPTLNQAETTMPKRPTAENLCLINVLRPLSSVKAVADI